MRKSILHTLTTVAALSLGCAPEVIQTPYGSFEIRPWGPDAEGGGIASSFPDPLTAPAKLQVTLSLFEDVAGTIVYGKSFTSLPEEFKDFKPVITVTASAATPTIVVDAAKLKVPRINDSQGSFFVKAEITGLDDSGKAITRGRCPIAEIKKDAAAKIVCRPFVGWIGKWNPLKAPAKNRFSFAAAGFSNGKVVIAGGRVGTVPDNTVEVFTPPTDDAAKTGEWKTITSTLSQPRFDLTAVAVQDQFAIFTGGKLTDSSYSQSYDLFDQTNDTLASRNVSLRVKRGEHDAALVGNDTIVIAGGYSAPNAPVPGLERVTPNGTDEANVSDAGRKYPCVVNVAENLVLICGGGDKKCRKYDGVGLNDAGDNVKKRDDVKCATVKGKVFMVGGAADVASGKTIEVWENNGQAPIEFVSETKAAINSHSVAASNGKIIVTGGYNVSDAAKTIPLSDGIVIDPDTQGVEILSGAESGMISTRALHRMVAFADGTVMAIGGKAPPATPTKNLGAEIYVVPDTIVK